MYLEIENNRSRKTVDASCPLLSDVCSDFHKINFFFPFLCKDYYNCSVLFLFWSACSETIKISLSWICCYYRFFSFPIEKNCTVFNIFITLSNGLGRFFNIMLERQLFNDSCYTDRSSCVLEQHKMWRGLSAKVLLSS